MIAQLRASAEPQTAEQLAISLGLPDKIEWVYKILQHLKSNVERGIVQTTGDTPDLAKFRTVG